MNKIILQLGQSKAILYFIMIIGFVLGYFNYSSSVTPIITSDPSALQDQDSIDSLAGFEIDFSILDDEIYRSLEIFGENPVDPGITGERRDPFAPI